MYLAFDYLGDYWSRLAASGCFQAISLSFLVQDLPGNMFFADELRATRGDLHGYVMDELLESIRLRDRFALATHLDKDNYLTAWVNIAGDRAWSHVASS